MLLLAALPLSAALTEFTATLDRIEFRPASQISVPGCTQSSTFSGSAARLPGTGPVVIDHTIAALPCERSIGLQSRFSLDFPRLVRLNYQSVRMNLVEPTEIQPSISSSVTFQFNSGLRIGHQAPGTQDLAEPAQSAHRVRGRDHCFEIQPVLRLDLLDHVVGAHEIGTRVLGFLMLIRAGDHQHAHAFTKAVRQDHCAADHLVGMLGVDAELHVDLNRLIELGVLDLLDERNRFLQGIHPRLDLTRGGSVFLWLFWH